MVVITRKSQLTPEGQKKIKVQEEKEALVKKGYQVTQKNGLTIYTAPTTSTTDRFGDSVSYSPHSVHYKDGKKHHESYTTTGGKNTRVYTSKTIDYTKTGRRETYWGAYGKATIKKTGEAYFENKQLVSKWDRKQSLKRLDKPGYVDPDTKRWVAKDSERDKQIQRAKHLTPSAQVKEYGHVITMTDTALKQEAKARGMSEQQVKRLYTLTPQARRKEFGDRTAGGVSQKEMSAYEREKALEEQYGKPYTFTERPDVVTRLSPEVSKRMAQAQAKEEAKQYAQEVDKSKQGATDIYYKPPKELGEKTTLTTRVRPKDAPKADLGEGWKVVETKKQAWVSRETKAKAKEVFGKVKKGYSKAEEATKAGIGAVINPKIKTFFSQKNLDKMAKKQFELDKKRFEETGTSIKPIHLKFEEKLPKDSRRKAIEGYTYKTGGKKGLLDMPIAKTTAGGYLAVFGPTPRFKIKGASMIGEEWEKIEKYNIKAPPERTWYVRPAKTFEEYKQRDFGYGMSMGMVSEIRDKPLKNIALLTAVPYGARQVGKTVGAGAMKGFVKAGKVMPLTVTKGVGYVGIGVAKATTPALLGGYGYLKYRQMKGQPMGRKGEILGRSGVELSMLMGGSLLSYKVPPQMKFGERAYEIQKLQAQTVMGYKGTPATIRLQSIAKSVGKGIKKGYTTNQPFRRDAPFEKIFGKQSTKMRAMLARESPIYQGSGVQYRYSKDPTKWFEPHPKGLKVKTRVFKDIDAYVRNTQKFAQHSKVDPHAYYERSAFPFARRPKAEIWQGYKEKYIKFGEQLSRKGVGMFTIRTGKASGKPELYRFTKDYNDYIETLKTSGQTKLANQLTNIQKVTPANVYYSKPSQFFHKIGLTKQSPEIDLTQMPTTEPYTSTYRFKLQPSMLISYKTPKPTFLTKKVATKSPSSSPKPSISPSISPSLSVSPSISPSISPSPSPSPSPSTSPSPSPSPSPSMSPSPSPSISPSISPSLSPSPSPSPSTSPSPSPSPSYTTTTGAGFFFPKFPKFKAPIYRTPKLKVKTKYSPTLHATLGNIKGPKPYKGKKIKLSGLEQRPILIAR